MTPRIPKQLYEAKMIKPIEIKDMNYIGNKRCHKNALSYAIKHRDSVERIIGGLQIYSSKEAYVHFIVELYSGKYVDPTFGNITNKEYGNFIIADYYDIDEFKPQIELIKLKKRIFEMHNFYSPERIFMSYKDM